MKNWVRPIGTIEQFEANDYVASCLEVSLQCMYPGKYNNVVESMSSPSDPIYTEYPGGPQHGLCGNPSESWISDSTGYGHEVVDGVVASNRVISQVLFGASAQKDRSLSNLTANNKTVNAEGIYYATWRSSNDGGKTYYYHKGLATVKQIDKSRPNHS